MSEHIGCEHCAGCHREEHGEGGVKQVLLPVIRLFLTVALTVAAIILPLENYPWYVRAGAFLIPYLIAGYDVIARAVKNIFHGKVFDECFLMTIATVGAFAIGEYPEAVAVMLLYQIGEFFQDLAVDRARDSVAELMDIRPEFADVLRDGKIIRVLPAEVAVGEIIVVRPGERFPLDGVIVSGTTTVDTSALTGESAPRTAAENDPVYSGSVNLTGAVEVRVTEVYCNSTVQRILDMVENSAEKKASSEAFITKFARIYTPAVVAGAVLLFVIGGLVTSEWTSWLRRALIFLVISCPCALVISVPLSFFGGIGGASRRGILIKGSEYLERLAALSVVVFDKTGTLTRGRFTVTAVHPETVTEDELLDVAAAAESFSSHPIAESIVNAHKGHIDRSRISDVEEIAGYGVSAVIDGKKVWVGNGKMMESAGADYHDCTQTGTIIHVAYQGEYLGHIVVDDQLKPDSADTVSSLRRMGVSKIIMLTGDLEKVGRAVSEKVGTDEAICELLPDGKVAEIERLLEEKDKKGWLTFVGDGINDAPALTRSDVGVAMGALGSDAAIEAADVVLMDDSPSKLTEAVGIARRTMSIVRCNIVFAIAAKLAVLVLGALGIAGMWPAVFADVGVALICVLNALRALRVRGNACYRAK